MGEKFEFHCPEPAHPDLAIAVGARANSPKPELPADARRLITEAMAGCGRITVIRIDGRPSVVGSRVFVSNAKTEQNHDLEKQNFIKDILALLAGAKAQQAEANVLQALSLAASAAGPGGTVVLIDSGVQTTAPMDLRAKNLPSRKPAAIVKALRQQRLLPDLRNRSVFLAGLGYTAAPQDMLAEQNRQFVVNLWREIVTAAGAKNPVLLVEPNTAGSAVTSPPVGVVTFPAADLKLGCDTLSVLPDNGDVGFVPDQAEFRNTAAARAVLQRLASFLQDTPGATVDIEGFIAHYGTGDLSQRRADRVKRELASLGVRNAVTAVGKGWGPYPHPTAPPDRRYDQLNRQVTISVTCG